MEEIHKHRKEIGNGLCEVLAIILFHPVICLHATLKAKYILFFCTVKILEVELTLKRLSQLQS